mgnify:CR=1 FL=1
MRTSIPVALAGGDVDIWVVRLISPSARTVLSVSAGLRHHDVLHLLLEFCFRFTVKVGGGLHDMYVGNCDWVWQASDLPRDDAAIAVTLFQCRAKIPVYNDPSPVEAWVDDLIQFASGNFSASGDPEPIPPPRQSVFVSLHSRIGAKAPKRYHRLATGPVQVRSHHPRRPARAQLTSWTILLLNASQGERQDLKME